MPEAEPYKSNVTYTDQEANLAVEDGGSTSRTKRAKPKRVQVSNALDSQFYTPKEYNPDIPPLVDPVRPVPVWGSIGGRGVDMSPFLSDAGMRRNFAVQQAQHRMAVAEFARTGEELEKRDAAQRYQNRLREELERERLRIDEMQAETNAAEALRRERALEYEMARAEADTPEARDDELRRQLAIRDEFAANREERAADRGEEKTAAREAESNARLQQISDVYSAVNTAMLSQLPGGYQPGDAVNLDGTALGAAVYTELEKGGYDLNDPELAGIVSSVIRRVVQQTSKDIRNLPTYARSLHRQLLDNDRERDEGDPFAIYDGKPPEELFDEFVSTDGERLRQALVDAPYVRLNELADSNSAAIRDLRNDYTAELRLVKQEIASFKARIKEASDIGKVPNQDDVASLRQKESELLDIEGGYRKQLQQRITYGAFINQKMVRRKDHLKGISEVLAYEHLRQKIIANANTAMFANTTGG